LLPAGQHPPSTLFTIICLCLFNFQFSDRKFLVFLFFSCLTNFFLPRRPLFFLRGQLVAPYPRTSWLSPYFHFWNWSSPHPRGSRNFSVDNRRFPNAFLISLFFPTKRIHRLEFFCSPGGGGSLSLKKVFLRRSVPPFPAQSPRISCRLFPPP